MKKYNFIIFKSIFIVFLFLGIGTNVTYGQMYLEGEEVDLGTVYNTCYLCGYESCMCSFYDECNGPNPDPCDCWGDCGGNPDDPNEPDPCSYCGDVSCDGVCMDVDDNDIPDNLDNELAGYPKSISIPLGKDIKFKIISPVKAVIAPVQLQLANTDLSAIAGMLTPYLNSQQQNKPVTPEEVKEQNKEKAESNTPVSPNVAEFNAWVADLMVLGLNSMYDQVSIDNCEGYDCRCDNLCDEDDDFKDLEPSSNPAVNDFFENNPDDSFRFKNYLTPDSFYITGYYAGFADGVIETIAGVVDIVDLAIEFSGANIMYEFVTDYDATVKKWQDRIETVKSLRNLQDPVMRNQIYTSIKNAASTWFKQTTFQNTWAEAGYQHGKIVFEVLGLFVGITEVKALLKTGQFSVKAMKLINNLNTVMSKGLKFLKVDGITSLVNDVGKVVSKGDDLPRVLKNLADEINDIQKSVIDLHKATIGNLSNKLKGNFGEILTDLKLSNKGYIPLHKRINNIDVNGHNGIDGIFQKNGKYYIAESKYSKTTTPSLNPANNNTGLPKQMSDDWITRNTEIRDALDIEALESAGINVDDLVNNIRKGYERVVITHGPDGSIKYNLVDAFGNIGSAWTP